MGRLQGGSELDVIRAVFLDVGETIVDESREYGAWADWLGVPRHTFSAVLGAVIARGQDYRDTFQYFKPGFDLAGEGRRRVAAGQPESWAQDALYPDARPCMEALRAMGLCVGLAGNQTKEAEAILRSLDLPLDVLATSDAWGVEKPSRGSSIGSSRRPDAGLDRSSTLVIAPTTTWARPSGRALPPPSFAGDRGATSCGTLPWRQPACSDSERWRSYRTW